MNNKALILLLLISTTGLFSCKDKDIPAPAGTVAYLSVVNATADTINYYINGTRQNELSFLYPGGSTAYTNALAGAQNYQFKRASHPLVYFTRSFTLDSGQYYSIFVGATSADKAFLVTDPLSAAGALTSDSTAVIRFVDAAPNAGTLNFVMDKGDTVNLQNKSFGYYSPFTVISGGSKEIKIYQDNAASPFVDTILTIADGSKYTLFTQGLPGAAVKTSFSVGLILNN